MNIVVDTNIVFSAILNSSHRIAEILIYPNPAIQFFSCDYLRTELIKHQEKLIKLSQRPLNEILELEDFLTQHIRFFNHHLLPTENAESVENVIKVIDPFDIPFVELTQHLNARLWTGDKKLIRALNETGFTKTITTQELLDEITSL